MKSDGTVWAWGANDFGQLGNATSLYSGTPVQVVRGNRPPVAVDDIFVVERSRPETMFLLSNDQDLDGDDLAYVIVTQPAQGMLNDSSIYDSLVVYTYTGLTCGDTDSFTYKANDGQADSNIGTVGISIDCAPTANDDFYSTPYETSLSVSLPGLLQNDVDLDGQNIFIPYGIPEPECNFFLPGDPERYYYQCELITQGGRVTYLSSGGAFIYVPNDGFSGQDSFLYTVSDGDYSSSGTVIIQIDDPSQDTVPPVITILGENPTTVEAGSIYVDAGATAFDDVDQDVTSIIVTGNNVHTGELGAQFVTYDVSDLAGNIATQVVRIVNVEDTTPPVLSVPPALTVEAIGELSLVNIGTANATDVFPVTITNDAPDAGFPLGLTIVNWTAIDGNGNTTAATQNVTVVDTTPPELLVPADVTVEATGPQTDVDIGLATASDIFEVTITNDALASYPLGTTEVTWTATDANANRVSAVQRVIVVDATSPELSLSVSPTVLWPPNHKLSPIEVITSATDAVDPNPVVTLTIVLSSEGDSEDTFDTAFDVTEVVGKKGDDIQLIDGQLYLRAERAGNSDGRVYTITYEATDYSGNSVTGSATVEVPHNQ